MRNATLKNSIYILVSCSAIAWLSLAYINDIDLSKFKEFMGLVPKVVSIDLLLIAIFAKWGWKLKVFRGWLVPFPNLNGTWLGYIYSSWTNPATGENPPKIPVMLTIEQSFFRFSCKMRTAEMESISYSESFSIDTDRQIKNMSYSYSSRPRLSLSERSAIHDGTIVFSIIEGANKKLEGRYWTERLTKGEIVLNHHCNELMEDFPSNIEEHPVTEVENKR